MAEIWTTLPGAVELVDGCKKISAGLGASVEQAFRVGYSVEQVRAVLSAGKAIADGPGNNDNPSTSSTPTRRGEAGVRATYTPLGEDA